MTSEGQSYTPIVLEHEDCYFYSQRPWSAQWLAVGQMPQSVLGWHLEQGFFVQGSRLYRPCCSTCMDCIPMRLDVNRVVLSKSQRRLLRQSGAIECRAARPRLTLDKITLYTNYHETKWGWPACTVEEAAPIVAQHLFNGWHGAVEITYSIDGHLLGYGILDVGELEANSRYFVWDVTDPRADGLGNFSLMKEIEWCQANGLQYLYLGMYVPAHPTMKYKVAFRPFELRLPQGGWTQFQRPEDLQWVSPVAPCPSTCPSPEEQPKTFCSSCGSPMIGSTQQAEALRLCRPCFEAMLCGETN